jgi:hypothetical protein
MTRAIVISVVALLGACSGGSSATSTPPDPSCGPLPITGGGMEASPGARFEDIDDATARAWTPSPDLRATASSRMEGGTLVVTATLTNTAGEERDAIYLTGGVMFASSNPLAVSVPLPVRPLPPADPSDPGSSPGPEVYPAPRRAILPPGGTLQVSAAICPAAYEHTPGQRVDLAWSLELWSEPKPRGTLSVVLP